MEISQNKLIALCGAVFGGIVLLNFFGQARSNEAFQQRLASIPDLEGFRSRLRHGEGLANLPEFDPSEFADAEPEPEPSAEG